MKRLTQALVMLCVFVLVYMIQMNHEFNVKAFDCDGQLVINVLNNDIKIELNGDIPDYKAFIEVVDSCNTSVEVTVDSHRVDTTTAGNYFIFYMATTDDGRYNTISLPVHVKTDILAPVISGYYDKYYFKKGDLVTESDFLTGVSATDDKDGDVSATLDLDLSEIDFSTSAVYTAYIKAVDSSENLTTVPINIMVVDEIPELILNAADYYTPVFDSLPDFLAGIALWDVEAQHINLTVDTSSIDKAVLGNYLITYTATLYNLKEEKEVLVHVIDDTPPVITGLDLVKLKVGENFNPYKYVHATDDYDLDISEKIIFIGEYDMSVPGKYLITAIVSDASGNSQDFQLELVVLENDSHIILWVSLILGIVIVGASGTLYFIRQKKEY